MPTYLNADSEPDVYGHSATDSIVATLGISVTL